MTSTTPTNRTDAAITIRLAREEDADALRRLAQLDAARVPTGDVLIAEVDGEPRAAMRILDRTYVADQFVPTRELINLLDVRARLISGERHDLRDRLRARMGTWSALWQRASASHPTQ